jgi:hypothetical protein
MCEIIKVEYILWCKENMIRPKRGGFRGFGGQVVSALAFHL